MDYEQIKAQKKHGDIKQVAAMLNITQSNASKAFFNSTHVRHQDVVFAVQMIIEARNLLTQAEI